MSENNDVDQVDDQVESVDEATPEDAVEDVVVEDTPADEAPEASDVTDEAPESTDEAATDEAAGDERADGIVAIGGGAASACVVGVLALGVAGAPRVDPRPPVTDLSRPTGPATPAVTGDDRAARGPVSPSRTPLAERLVAIREKIAP